MRARRLVRCLSLAASREENDKVMAEYRLSRYPLLDAEAEKPLGYVHIKDLFLAERAGKPTNDLRAFLRPCLLFKEQDALEPRLSEMQRKASHMALVFAEDGRWTGIITLEDAIEEVIGTIEEEYPTEPSVRLSDLLTPEHTLLDVEGDSILSATRSALKRISGTDLPVSKDAIMLAVAERERLGSSYVGRRLAIPHARLARLIHPMVIVARMKSPIPAPVPGEDINLLFILLTPSDTPRIHQILLMFATSQPLPSQHLGIRSIVILHDCPTLLVHHRLTLSIYLSHFYHLYLTPWYRHSLGVHFHRWLFQYLLNQLTPFVKRFWSAGTIYSNIPRRKWPQIRQTHSPTFFWRIPIT